MVALIAACFIIDAITMLVKKRRYKAAKAAGIHNSGENLIAPDFPEPYLPTDRAPTELEYRMHKMWEFKTQYFLKNFEKGSTGYIFLALGIFFTFPLIPLYLVFLKLYNTNRMKKYNYDYIAFSAEENNHIVYTKFAENFTDIYFEKNFIGKSIFGTQKAPGLYPYELPRDYFFLSAQYQNTPFELSYFAEEGAMRIENTYIRSVEHEHCLRFTVKKSASSPVIITSEKGAQDIKHYFKNEKLADVDIENERFNRFFAVYSRSAHDVFYILTPQVIDFLNSLFLVEDAIEIAQTVTLVYENNTVTVYISGSDCYFLYPSFAGKGLPPDLRKIDRGIAFIKDFMTPFIPTSPAANIAVDEGLYQ